MPRGAPDDSDVQKLGLICRLDDMGELAARLGSPMLYHRFGDVVFMETFETGIARWRNVHDGGVISHGLSTDAALSEGLSYLFDANATTACWGKILHYNAPITTPKIGLSFAFYADRSEGKIRFGLEPYDGAKKYAFYLQYDLKTGKLSYRTTTPTWTEFADHGVLYTGYDVFHQVKLIVDYVTREYDRLFIDEEVYDLSAYPPRISSAEENPCIIIDIGFSLDVGDILALYLDDIILTQNEV